jgi:hypothetical protein
VSGRLGDNTPPPVHLVDPTRPPNASRLTRASAPPRLPAHRCRFPQQHVYAVVSNVAEYKHFVPWCIDSVVKRQEPRYLEADLSVGFQFFSERYASRVTLDPERRVVVRRSPVASVQRAVPQWGARSEPSSA